MTDRSKAGAEEPSSREARVGVKERRISRHFEGWELGLVALGIALLGAILAVPRAVLPRDLPLPVVDERLLARAQAADRDLAASLRAQLIGDQATELFDLRALGTAFRAYGRAERQGVPAALVRPRDGLEAALLRAKAFGPDKLLALRAYEEGLFLAELARWEKTGTESDELVGLGGAFVPTATENGWADRHRWVKMSDPLRGVFFKRRWNEIMGLTTDSFALTPAETISFYGFLLGHPWSGGAAGGPPDSSGAAESPAARAAERWRLRKVDELANLDPTYPRDLARGVLLLRLGDATGAVVSLQRHLTASPDGPHTLRARNYLKAALARASSLN